MTETTRWLSAEEQRVWQRFRMMTRSLDARLAHELSRGSGLSMQDYDVLSSLTDAPRQRRTAKELGAHLLWTPSRLSHHLDRMQRRQLVRREPALDGRGSDVVLTTRGLEAIEQAAPDHVEAVRRSFFDHLAPHQLATLAGINDTVLAELRE